MSFQLTAPGENVCPACGIVLKTRARARHKSSESCRVRAHRLLVERNQLVRFWGDTALFRRAGVPVVWIAEPSGARKRRPYVPAWAGHANDALRNAGWSEAERARLLRAGPGEELDRELAVAALAAPREDAAVTGHWTRIPAR